MDVVAIAAWVQQNEGDIFLSVVSFAELQFGVDRAPVAHRPGLAAWLAETRRASGPETEPLTEAVPVKWEELLAGLKAGNRTMTCEHYWGEAGEPIEEWAEPIIARGPRPEFVMEQVLPGCDPAEVDSDSICQANALTDAGDRDGARRMLMSLCEADLRCLDAHAHLGNLTFDHVAKDALRHFEVRVRIGELSLGADFDGLLPWGYIDNRPFLLCLNGYGLCLWRLQRFAEAEQVFSRMLWLNPTDNQGVRFLLTEVRSKKAWLDPEAAPRPGDGSR